MKVFILKKINVIRALVCVILIIGVVSALTILSPKDVSAFSGGNSAMITNGDKDSKNVALTIDTAFGEDKTAEILQIL